MAAVGALGSTARLGCLVRLSTQLGRERSSERLLFKNNLRLLSHTLALNTPTYDWREDDVASTYGLWVSLAGGRGGTQTLAVHGLEELFFSCAVVSVFGSGGKYVLVLHILLLMYLEYNTIVVLC
jgi:hypothetical protein